MPNSRGSSRPTAETGARRGPKHILIDHGVLKIENPWHCLACQGFFVIACPSDVDGIADANVVKVFDHAYDSMEKNFCHRNARSLLRESQPSFNNFLFGCLNEVLRSQ